MARLFVIGMLMLLACSNRQSSRAAGSGRDAGSSAESRDARVEAGSKTDAEGDSGTESDADTQACPGGSRVPARVDCIRSDPYCYELADGGWCTGAPPMCPVGAEPIATDAECSAASICWFSRGVRCTSTRRDDTFADDEDAGASPIRLGFADRGTQVPVSIGQRVDISLETGAGYYLEPWLSSVSVQFLGSDAPTDEDAGAVRVFRFRCSAKGSTAITLLHSMGIGDFLIWLQCD